MPPPPPPVGSLASSRKRPVPPAPSAGPPASSGGSAGGLRSAGYSGDEAKEGGKPAEAHHVKGEKEYAGEHREHEDEALKGGEPALHHGEHHTGEHGGAAFAGDAHPGFQAVEKKIAARGDVRNPGAVLAAATRRASPAAKKANPRLNRVKG